MNYETNNMTASNATYLVDIAKKAKELKFPNDNELLKQLCNNAHDYMIKNSLKETAFFEQLNKRMNNFKYPITGDQIHKDIFYHMQTELTTHGALIATKFRIGGFKDFV